jgi:hypothetical protein
MVTDFMILSTQKFSVSFTRTETLKIHKYLDPGYLLWVATDPCMIQASKELHIILSRSLSGRLPGSRLAHMGVSPSMVGTIFLVLPKSFPLNGHVSRF